MSTTTDTLFSPWAPSQQAQQQQRIRAIQCSVHDGRRRWGKTPTLVQPKWQLIDGADFNAIIEEIFNKIDGMERDSTRLEGGGFDTAIRWPVCGRTGFLKVDIDTGMQTCPAHIRKAPKISDVPSGYYFVLARAFAAFKRHETSTLVHTQLPQIARLSIRFSGYAGSESAFVIEVQLPGGRTEKSELPMTGRRITLDAESRAAFFAPLSALREVLLDVKTYEDVMTDCQAPAPDAPKPAPAQQFNRRRTIPMWSHDHIVHALEAQVKALGAELTAVRKELRAERTKRPSSTASAAVDEDEA